MGRAPPAAPSAREGAEDRMSGLIEDCDVHLFRLRERYVALTKENDQLRRDVKKVADQKADAMDEIHALREECEQLKSRVRTNEETIDELRSNTFTRRKRP
jgi:predicted  nucleic acid-binding Zn-ribbon protein